MKITKKQILGKMSFMICVVALLLACGKQLKPTAVEIIDPIRHYYPILQGEILSLDYEIYNIGTEPLVINDIQTSCGCIVTDKHRHIVAPGKKVSLTFKYNSAKNIGMVKNTIYLFGNFSTGSMLTLGFDIDVISPSDFIPDYEEIYFEQRSRSVSIGEEGNKSVFSFQYYVDEPDSNLK